MKIEKPDLTAVPAYYVHYINLVPQTDLLAAFTQSLQTYMDIVTTMDIAKAAFQYAPGKWTVKQLLSRINDTE